MNINEIENYVKVIIPRIEEELGSGNLSGNALTELYFLYVDVLRLVAPYNFHCFNKYIEIDEDHKDPNKAFYHHRREHLAEIFDTLNDMEIYDLYDYVLISTPPRVGKTTTGVRFLAWIIGRHPDHTQLATSYSDLITNSFYAGVMEVALSERYKDVFPDAPIVNQNAKRQEIWLKLVRRYPSIAFISIAGSMTGRGEAKDYLYCDDLVSGIEEALSVTRMEKLNTLYNVNAKQRKKDGAKEIHIATYWSVHDPMSKLAHSLKDNPRAKIIKIPCYNSDGESNFDFFGGFSTNYYKELEGTMDPASFSALYLCEPIEREGILYPEDELQYYFDLPSEAPDSIIAVCDSKNLGKDFVSSPIGYVYGDFVYIEDVVFNNGLPEVTRPLVANKWVEYGVVRGDVEVNNGGNYYAEGVNELIKAKGGKTSIRTFFSSNNKQVKIITYSDFVKKYFIFKHPSKYAKGSEYDLFMRSVLTWTQKGNNKYDDGPDSLAMLAILFQDLSGMSIKILDRRKLGV